MQINRIVIVLIAVLAASASGCSWFQPQKSKSTQAAARTPFPWEQTDQTQSPRAASTPASVPASRSGAQISQPSVSAPAASPAFVTDVSDVKAECLKYAGTSKAKKAECEKLYPSLKTATSLKPAASSAVSAPVSKTLAPDKRVAELEAELDKTRKVLVAATAAFEAAASRGDSARDQLQQVINRLEGEIAAISSQLQKQERSVGQSQPNEAKGGTTPWYEKWQVRLGALSVFVLALAGFLYSRNGRKKEGAGPDVHDPPVAPPRAVKKRVWWPGWLRFRRRPAASPLSAEQDAELRHEMLVFSREFVHEYTDAVRSVDDMPPSIEWQSFRPFPEVGEVAIPGAPLDGAGVPSMATFENTQAILCRVMDGLRTRHPFYPLPQKSGQEGKYFLFWFGRRTTNPQEDPIS